MVTDLYNPYVTGNPVGNSPAFIGRADVQREVLRVLRRPQDNAIVLYGQRRIGKTSILQNLAASLPVEGPYCPVYFDLEYKSDWTLPSVLEDLATIVANALHQAPPDLQPAPEEIFRSHWLPAVLGGLPENSSLVLLLDEFDVLADPESGQAGATFFPYVRELLTSDPERLQFVFVIGRGVTDLDNIARALFKGTPAQRVSLLNQEDTFSLVRLSEVNGTMQWSDEAVQHVWHLTHGHPFLTQQLCSYVWELAYDRGVNSLQVVTSEDVVDAVPHSLETSRNTLEWLWDGLPPAERVVASALAEAGPDPITQEDLEGLLHESGVRVVIRELQNAPQLLQDWDLIEPADPGYRFRVELLRQWITREKPLRRVQEELDRIQPVAENLYQAARGLYRGDQLEQTHDLLRQSISLNPNHIGANLLLADVLLLQKKVGEARQLLERFYRYQPAAARPRLVQVLLQQIQDTENEDEELALSERVLQLEPDQPEAMAEWQRIWQKRGSLALAAYDFDAALEAYKAIGLTEKVSEIEEALHRRNFVAQIEELESLEQAGQYHDALGLARHLAEEYSTMRDWSPDLGRLERKTRLADLYNRSLVALEKGERQGAQALLAEVVAIEPVYQEATRYLHLAVTGIDAGELRAEVANLRKELAEERRKVEERTREWQYALERAAAAEKLAIMGEVAAEFAHRMNNLAGTIPVRAAMIKEGLSVDDPRDARIIKALDRIVQDSVLLLDAAREIKRSSETRAPEQLEINELLDVGIERSLTLQPDASTRIMVEKIYSDDIPTLTADRGRFLDTIISLVRNALEAMPEKGKLTVITKKGFASGIPNVEIVISDTGIGIPQHSLSKIFDLFFTTKETGLGFGLWRDRVFITSLGGTIEVTSRVGEGSTFVIRLPMEKDEED